MNAITKRDLPARVIKKIQRHGIRFQVGDVMMCVNGWREGLTYRVERFTVKGIKFVRLDGDVPTQNWDRNCFFKWSEWSDVAKDFVKLDGKASEIEALVLKRISEGGGYYDEMVPDPDAKTDETALALSAGREGLEAIKNGLERRRQEIAVAHAIIASKAAELKHQLDQVKAAMERVEKVVGVLELYLGVNEEIVQIRTGAPAGANEPVCLRQMLLFMDEEVGDPRDGGYDFQNVPDFDSWVCEPEHLQQVLPEQKGVVAIRPRRTKKWYCNDPWVNTICNFENEKTYLLIRNGDLLFRVWMPIVIHPRLFPTKDEQGPIEETESFFERKDRDKSEFEYKRYGIMLQGLIGRSECFKPMAHQVNVFNESTWKGLVKFIRDDETALPSGRLPWNEFVKEINASIDIGTRVIWFRRGGYDQGKFMDSRVAECYRYCSPPRAGLYTVTGRGTGDYWGNDFTFLYNPGDPVFRRPHWRTGEYDDSPRKKRISFGFNRDECLNFDQVSMEEIEFYMRSRTDRRHYAMMMGILIKMKEIRRKELDRENELVKLIRSRIKTSEERVRETIEWWKTKNKWKRPVSEDDAKAYRMIMRRLKKG